MPSRQRQQHEELRGEEPSGKPEDGVEGAGRNALGAEGERRGCADRVTEPEHHGNEGADARRGSLEVERQRHHHREQAALGDAGKEGACVRETGYRHEHDRTWVHIGTGDWDYEGRASWVRLDRVLDVPEEGIRREGAVLARETFEVVAKRLRAEYSWS